MKIVKTYNVDYMKMQTICYANNDDRMRKAELRCGMGN